MFLDFTVQILCFTLQEDFMEGEEVAAPVKKTLEIA